MEAFLTVMAAVLLGLNVLQYSRRRKQNRDLCYMYEKLQAIVAEKTGEKLLLATDHQELQKLLVEINHLLEAIQLSNAEHAKVEMSMRRMLANISHDLNTPLTVILGYAEILQTDHSLSEAERQALVQNVRLKTNEVMELIRKFFDLAKLESGDKEIEFARINVNEICRKTILSFYDLLTAKGFSVHIDISEDQLYAWGNEEVLSRILHNLLSNAIAYGGEGKTVGIAVRNSENFLYIDIWDKGKGISESHIDKVFERMYTLEDSRNRSYQGSGLGLTITKRLVEVLGGEIHLSSKPYEKTMFTVALKKWGIGL
ncbi:sensor histidine kinase [Bacillus xiapuensis]|uniref:sensor histidine kinase n=1 Tax=Bacillus xiapuensis TaxID=2014075 RepID=UPI000C24EB93|nr:sensor histidine kinase [Bacillus xiapuensis]